MMIRRICLVLSVLVVVSTSLIAQSNLQKIANLQWEGNIRLKYQDRFVGVREQQEGQFKPAGYQYHYYLLLFPDTSGYDRYTFHLQIGTYTGGIRGYWIRRDMAGGRAKQHYWVWQPQGDNTIQYWNQDSVAKGPPEDLEMWYFEIVDEAKTTVRIKNLYKGYIQYRGDRFCAGANKAEAAVFTLQFV